MTGRSTARSSAGPLKPTQARKLHEAFAAQQAGHLDKAERLYGEVLRQRPNEFNALHMLGLIAYRRRRFADALRLIGAALRSDANSADAWSNLGLAFHAQREYAQALDSYERALTLKPDHADVLNNRGNALRGLGRRDAALESFAKALTLRPDYVDALYNRGSTLLELGRAADALECFEAALAVAPRHVESICHRGNALLLLNRVEDAVASFALAASIAPDHALIVHNHAYALRHAGRPRQALARAEAALRLNPGYGPSRFEQAVALLALGELRRGFALYEARWEMGEFAQQKRDFAAPLWRGDADLAGKTVLLHAEQGFGDTLQFARYAPLVAARGAAVILEVQPQLKTLLMRNAGAAQVIARGEPPPPFDLHCPLMSLPLAFGTALDTIPANVPYLAADPAKIAHWAARLATFGGKRKVGIVWAGDARHHNPNANSIDGRRSMTLRHFAPLASVADLQLISLQKGTPAAQAKDPPPGLPLVDWTAALDDFADTAALIANLDLVICVDTAVAHLVGGLGKPVWILSRFDCCWRWLDRRADSPWYPTARLFYQDAPGAWDDVVARVRAELERAPRPGTAAP